MPFELINFSLLTLHYQNQEITFNQLFKQYQIYRQQVKLCLIHHQIVKINLNLLISFEK